MRTVKTWLATIAVLLCSISASAYNFQVDGIYYKILSETDKTVEITRTPSGYAYKKYSGYIIIPESIEYGGIYRVVGIGEGAFKGCSDLYSVTIPNSVTNIGDEAFYECSKLTSVTIPNSVTNIGEYAFYSCDDLTSVTIGNGIVSIGTSAFGSCYNLKSVHIEDIAAWCKIEFESLTCNPLSEAKTLYLNGQEVTDLVIPNSVNSIGDYAFHGCESLTSVTFGDNVTSIGSDAFTYCSNLISVTIPRSVTTINTWAFTNCNKLEAVYIEDMEAWLNIDFGNLYANPLYYAGTLYLNGEKVTELEFPQCVTCIKGYTFPGFDALSTLVIPNHITSIGSRAFYACQALKSITIPSSVTEIGYDAFHLCNNQYNQLTVYIENIATWYNIDFANSMSNPLSYAETLYLNKEKVTELVIPDGVVCIKDYAFYNYDGLTSVTIPNSVTSIGDNAFYDCDKLASVTIPNSVTSIGAEAFCSCDYLDNVEIPNSVATIGKYAFYDTPWYNLQTEGVIYAGKFLLGYKGTMPANTSIEIKEGTAFIAENAFSGCANLTSVEIPNSVISIGDYAFDGCSGLTSVVIPNSVTSIGDYAFDGCLGLTSVTIPNSVTSIGDWAFVYCSGLTSVTIPNSVTSIGSYAFSYCEELLDVYCYAENVPSVDSNVFTYSYPERATLHVPAASLESYKSTSPWSSFGNIVALPQEITLEDGVEYENNTDEDMSQITYTRTLNNTEWNALYLPFEIPVSQLTDKYEVAYINAIHSYDEDDNGEIDCMSMEVIKLREGTLHANHPYLIKARTAEAKQMSITVENTMLYKAESRTLDCSSVYTKFEITGIYEKMTSEQLAGCYALSGGSWKNLTSGSTLNPFRLYLRVSSREGSPVKLSEAAMARIGIHVQGEETATSVEERLMQKQHKADAVYDLSGRRVTNPKKGQIYIVNGKKRMY